MVWDELKMGLIYKGRLFSMGREIPIISLCMAALSAGKDRKLKLARYG